MEGVLLLTYVELIGQLDYIYTQGLDLKRITVETDRERLVHSADCADAPILYSSPRQMSFEWFLEDPASHLHEDCFEDAILNPQPFFNQKTARHFTLTDFMTQADTFLALPRFGPYGKSASFEENIMALDLLLEFRPAGSIFSEKNYTRKGYLTVREDIVRVLFQIVDHLLENHKDEVLKFLTSYSDCIHPQDDQSGITFIPEYHFDKSSTQVVICRPAPGFPVGFKEKMALFNTNTFSYSRLLFAEVMLEINGRNGLWQVPANLISAAQHFGFLNPDEHIVVASSLEGENFLTFTSLCLSFADGTYSQRMAKAYRATMALI